MLHKDLLHIVAHDLPVARHGISAAGACAITATAPIGLTLAPLRQRLRRPVRGPRHQPVAARQRRAPRRRRRPRSCSAISGLDGKSRAHDAHIRSGADELARTRRSTPRAGARRNAADLPRRSAATAGRPEQPAVPSRACSRAGASCEPRRATRPRSRPRTSCSTRCCAASAADLQMLMTDTPQGRYPYAGIPWYSTTFGRDGLITALQMLWCDPSVARGVLRRLAAYQATEHRSALRRQPGKILHEMRDGEMAALRRGAVRAVLRQRRRDAALRAARRPLRRAHRRPGDDRRAVAERSRRRSHWIDGHGDPDGDGFVEYRRATEQGLANQGWKDSHDAIFHADGRLAEGADRALRSPGLRLCRQAARRALRAPARPARTARRARSRGRAARRALRSGLLVRGTRHLCAGARRRQAALPRAHVECRPGAVHRHRRADAPRAVAAGSAAAASSFRGWGIRTVAQRRGALQSDVLSQRLGLAARQRADRARASPATA